MDEFLSIHKSVRVYFLSVDGEFRNAPLQTMTPNSLMRQRKNPAAHVIDANSLLEMMHVELVFMQLPAHHLESSKGFSNRRVVQVQTFPDV